MSKYAIFSNGQWCIEPEKKQSPVLHMKPLFTPLFYDSSALSKRFLKVLEVEEVTNYSDKGFNRFCSAIKIPISSKRNQEILGFENGDFISVISESQKDLEGNYISVCYKEYIFDTAEEAELFIEEID